MSVLAVIAYVFGVCSEAHAAAVLKVAAPAPGKVYHAAFPGLSGSEDRVTQARLSEYERAAGRRMAWVYVSNNWLVSQGIRFPAKNVQRIRAHGSVPFVRLMARSRWNVVGADPRYTMQRIIDGRFDAGLRRWFRAARMSGGPLMVEFGTEVNGDWFSWNGRWAGAGHRIGYGNPRLPDGPGSRPGDAVNGVAA